MATAKTISFQLNGAAKQVEISPSQTVLEVLRETCRITSIKDACSPQGLCGCCLTLIDGQPKNACALIVLLLAYSFMR